MATLTYGMLLTGLALRRRRRLHMPLMIGAMTIDLGLVVYIEWSRAAVEKLVAGGPGPLVVFHAAVSTVVLGLYVAMAVLGNRLRRGGERWRPAHRRAAWALVSCRTANYVTSWML